MTPEDSSATNETQMHDGYNLEAGFLTRLREWPDIFPWLRLIRILRVVGSPPLFGLVALTLVVWKIGITLLALEQATPEVPAIASTANQQFNFFTAFIGQLNPASVFDSEPEIVWWKTLLGIGWSVFIWTPVVLLLTRQGGLLTAGRVAASERTTHYELFAYVVPTMGSRRREKKSTCHYRKSSIMYLFRRVS